MLVDCRAVDANTPNRTPSDRASAGFSRLRRGRPAPKLKSPLARAVVPVAAGIAFFAALFGVTYLIAAVISDNTEGIRIGDREFEIGRADIAAERIAKYGPLLYADLKGTEGEQAIVVDHDPNAIDTEGWSIYFAYLASSGPECLVAIDKDTQRLQDCDGNAVTSDQLQPAAPEAEIVVETGNKPTVKIRFAAAQVVPTTTTG